MRTIPKAVIWSLLLTGAFMVFMSYIEVFATRHAGTALSNMAIPLSTISDIYKVSFFKVPIALGAMVSFFSLSLSCLNAGARIIFPMARHQVFPAAAGKAHPTHQTPYVALTAFIVVMFAVPSILQIWTNPLTTFNDAGTLAAFGFLTAYFLIAIAAPAYLKKLGELKTRNIVIAVIGFACLLVPLVGSFYPAPPWPVWTFPYIFLGYMAVGGIWLYTRSRRQAGLLTEIEVDLEHAPEMIDAGSAREPTVIDLTRPRLRRPRYPPWRTSPDADHLTGTLDREIQPGPPAPDWISRRAAPSAGDTRSITGGAGDDVPLEREQGAGDLPDGGIGNAQALQGGGQVLHHGVEGGAGDLEAGVGRGHVPARVSDGAAQGHAHESPLMALQAVDIDTFEIGRQRRVRQDSLVEIGDRGVHRRPATDIGINAHVARPPVLSRGAVKGFSNPRQHWRCVSGVADR